MVGNVTPKRLPRPRTLLGWDGTDFFALKVDDSGHLQIDVLSSVMDADAATAAAQASLLAVVARKATTPVIHRVIMTLADTEYSQLLPANCKKFLVKCRANYAIRVAFGAGLTTTTYLTVPAGMSYWEDLLQITGLTLYLRCMTAAQVVEIVAWV